jgi:hypothetical protein
VPTATPIPRPTATPVPTPTPTPAQLIVGKWQQVNGTTTFRFFQTGELLQTNVGLFGPVDIQGTYRFLAPTTIRLDFKDLFATSATWDLKFSNDRMTVSGSFGSVEYVRTQ